ncbi:LPD38 domain-containing protein [Barnesiella intestinihominis]|uniref:putative polyvalent protein kinase domain-containing protein n=1 Tax=Barnesiella intestinihominis TaxID=487174 RepID=UPI003966DBC1
MPIYRANGNRYNIPDDKIQDFERRYPESKVEMYDGEGKKYAIPLSKRNKFQQRYEKWSYVTEETKKKSPNTFVSNQNPSGTIVSEDELENSIADYEESLGHGKYGAGNTPLFQKVRQAANSAEQIADGIIDKNWISQSPSSARDSEIGEVSVGRRGSTSTHTPVSDAYKSQFDKPLEDRFADARTRLEKDVVFQFENMLNKIEEDINENSEWRNESEQIENEGDIFKNYKGYKNITEDTIEDLEREGYVPKEIGELSQKRSVQNLTRKYISEARDVIEMYKRKDGNGLANFADAFARSFDSGILTLGATDAIDMGRLLAIANKIGDNGEGFEKLTKEEQQLMAAFSLLDQIQGSLQLDTWQNIGQGTMQSLPFLAQFALTGGVGAAASAATKAAAKTAVKKIIGKSASKAVSRIAANAGKNAAGRVAVKAASKLGNAAIDGLVGGTVMALTSGAGHTAEDVMSRMVGNHDIRLDSINDPGGELKTIYTHHGVEDRESLGLSFLKGFAANLIENGTEYMGNYMGLNLGKLLSRFKGGRQLLTKPLIGKTTRFARQVGKLTGFNGFIPEVAEEELGMLLNAATVGDVEWEDISDPEQQFQTVMAVGIMSLGFQVANSIGVGLTYNKYRKAKKRYESKDLGEGLSVDDIIHGLDNVPLDRRADYVMAMVNTHDLGKGDAKDLQDFVMARTGYEFILGKIESDAEEAGDKAAEAEMRLINKEMGGKVTVTLLDGREAILTVGNVSLEPNAAGEYTTTTQSGSLIAVPVGIGNTPIMVSPKDIRSVSIMSTEDAVGQARAMAEDITKTNMASQIENEADEVESDEQSRTPSSTMSGGEIGELSPRDEGVEKQPLYRKSELEIGDVVTFKDYSDPDNPGVERTLKIIGIDDSGVDVEDVVDGVPLPLSIKPEQITHVKGKEKKLPVTIEENRQTAPQSEITDTSEYTRFVEDGTVEDSTVLRIANKIANGEQLTREEEAMRQEVSQRVEDKLREIQQNVEGKEETDRWAKYRKSNGEVDEKKMPLREQFEYGEEIAGVKAMIEVAKAGTKKTQSEIARLEKEIEREISPVKRVNKEKQLKSLNERLGTYQQYLEDNNSDLQSLKATPANIVDRISALGDIKSLRDYILRLVATGNIKFKWGDTDSSKGLASHLGINDSPGERRKRISLLSNSGYTPEQLAHNIWEQQDVQNSDLPFKGYETDEILDEILDVMSSVYSPSQALELAEQIANEDLRKQEMASQDYESHELEQSSIEQIELEPLPDDLAPRNDIAFRRNELGEIQSGQTKINERESNSNKENSLSSQEEKQIDSQDEILQSIPQRERGTEAQKDRRMEEAERAIRRSQSSGTNETQFGGSQSALSRQEIEARAAEEYAKENGLWIPMDKVFDLGTPGPSGNENDTYISNEGYVYKVNNLMNSKGILPLFDRIKLHNQIFPSSRYEFVGFTGFDGRSIYPIFRQAYVHESTNATPEEIEEYMNTLGFSKINEHKYTNGDITISDLRPRNVLKDTDGDLYVVDAEFQQEGRSDKETADKTNPRQPDNTDSTGSPLSENESSGISSSPTNSETPVSDIKDNPNASTGQEKPRLSTQKTLQERRQEIQEYIEREAGKLNIPVRIVGDVSQISPSEKNYTRKLTSQGWYDQTTGEIVIVAPNHGSIRDAQRTLLHEAVAHYGLPAMLGRENFDKLCDQVWDSMTDRERAVFGAYIDEKIDDKSYNSLTEEEKERYAANDFSGKRAAADEYLAHFAEEGITNPSLWSKIKRLIKEAFRKIGIDLSLTDSDIAYLLWKSKNRITDKDSTTDIIRKSAADTRIKGNIGSTRFRTIVVNPRYGSKIETVRTNHTSVYKAVDKYLRENFDEKDYTTHTAKTGSRYLELNIGNDTLKVRFANHTPRMEASDNMYTIGNGKEITFFPGGDIGVEIDISLSGDRSKEIIDLIKGMKEYSSSEVKKEVSSLIDGAKTDPFPDVASPQLIEELSHCIGTEMAGTLDTQIAEYYKYRVNENVYKQESKSRDSKLKQNKYVLEQYKTIFRDFVQESPKLIKAVGGGYWYNGATGSIRIVPPFPIDYGMLSDKLMSSHFIPILGINKKEGKRQIVQEYVDEWSGRLTDSGIFLSEEYVSEGAKITEAQQEIDNIREQYNFWVKAKLNTGTSADIRYRTAEEMEEVNQRFNEELEQQIEGRLEKGHVYQLGRPSEFLRDAGIPDLPIEMPASQLEYKSTSGKHDYDLSEVINLPNAIAHPIATFAYGDSVKSQNILTVLEHNGENFLVGMFIRPKIKGNVLEVNSIRNVFPKNGASIVKWINQGKLTNVDKEKLLHFLDQQRTNLADVAFVLPDEQVKQGSAEVSTATNIVENFENPKLTGENSNGTMNTRFRREAPDVSSYIKISMDRKGIVDLSQLSPDQSQRIRKSAPAAYGAKISGDIASFPDYQEAENCLTYIFDNNDIISDDIRNSIDNGTLPQDIAMIFDAALRRGMERRVWIDRYQPLEALQKLISSTLGKEISEKENAWEYTGFMDSRIKAEADEYNADYYLPLLELYEKIIHGKNGVDEDTLVDYMLIKHGIERNQVMRREALEEWEESHKGVEDYDKKRTGYIQELSTRDYSGYFDRFKQEYAPNYNTAEDFISEVESLLGENTVINLWDKIKKATNKTLDISVKSGLVSKEDADTYKKRFQFYVPLRGFSEETMDQMYDSNIRINPGSTVNKQAKGRTSRADNPLVSIMAMANTEIARANKNKMKQRLLTLLAGKDVRNKFGYSYEVEYKDGKEKILKYKPKQSDEIKKITTISNIYQIIPKYEILALDTNGNPILDEHGNKTWVETDEVPSAEQLESGMARFSKAYPSNRGTVHKTPSQMEESTVDVFVAGKKVSILFTNPLVSNSINGRLNLDKNVPRKIETPDQWYNIPGWLTYGSRHLNRLGARTTRALSQFYTTYSPAFFLFSNFARDFSGAFAYNSAEKSIAEARQIAALAPDSFAAMRRYIRGESKNKRYTIEEIESFLDRMGRKGKISKSDYDIAAYLFVSRGGETGYISANTVEDYRKSIDNAVKYGTVDMNKQAKAIKKGYMAGVKAIQDTARLMESVTRLNQFVAALREGKTIDAAITDAKNVSTNFNRRGSHEGIQWIFDNYAFLNASLQGTDRLYMGIKKYKKGFAKVIGTIISIGFLDSLLCAIFSGDDDRWGDAYHALPETKRYNNLVIPVGEGKFIFIPLAQSLRGFHAWGIMLADIITGYHKKHPLISDPVKPLDFFAVIGQDIVPITYGSWTNAAPTWTQPIAHIAFNENFMGRPLYKETPWNENLPEFRKAYGSTPKGLVKWSEFVNEMTGGNYAEKGWLEQIPVLEKLNNPAVLQQLYLGYVPGLFRVLGQAYNAVDALVTKTKGRPTDFDLSDVPIIGAAVGEANDRIPKAKLRSKWYEFANKARDSKRADSELLKELFIDEFIENTRDSDKVLNKSVYDGLNVHIRNLMKLEGMAETWEDDLVSGDLPADEAIRTSAEIASLRNTIDNTLYDIINELKIAQ